MSHRHDISPAAARASRVAKLLFHFTQSSECQTVEEALAAAEILFELGKRSLPPNVVALAHALAWEHIQRECGS